VPPTERSVAPFKPRRTEGIRTVQSILDDAYRSGDSCERGAGCRRRSHLRLSRLSWREEKAAMRWPNACACFNREGLPALEARHGGGPPFRYTAVECERILREFRQAPDRRLDGTTTWSLVTLQRALRRAPTGVASRSNGRCVARQMACPTSARIPLVVSYTKQDIRGKRIVPGVIQARLFVCAKAEPWR
jgi:hypothetical protein